MSGNIIHKDPHPGNMFRDKDWTYIDTGLVKRTPEQLTQDLGYTLDFVTGNSKSIATRIINQAEMLPNDVSKEELIEKLSSRLDKNLFKAGINVKDMGNNQNILGNILHDMGIMESPNRADMLKAQLQTATTYNELMTLAGQEPNTKLVIKNLVKGLSKSFIHTPRATSYNLLNMIHHFTENPTQTARTLYPFVEPVPAN